MAQKMECPRCGRLSAGFIEGVCRACYMRDFHQRRSAAAVTQCPRCSVASANFVHGVCRACYMRDYHQRRSAAAVKDKQVVLETPTLIGNSEGQHLCVKCKAPRIYAHGLCLNCYMRDRHCVECGALGIYARGLCRNCYVMDRRQLQRFCVECGAPGVSARSLCQKCYMRELRHDRRIKRRVCAVCGVSFQSVRRDARYCSSNCGQKAHRAGKAQRFPKAADANLARFSRPSQAHAVANIDGRLNQIDSTIEEAAKCGRTGAALSAIDGQRKARQMLAGGRRDVSTLPDLKAECATLGADGRGRGRPYPPRH
jgi:NMD protein affecting ribosome stability and mRNA decay